VAGRQAAIGRARGMSEAVRIVWGYVLTYWKMKMMYRANFWVDVFSDCLFVCTNVLFIYVLFGHTPQLAGWTREQILFIYGFFMVPWGVFSTIFNVWDFTERYVVKGELDRILTRPVHSLVQLLLENIDPSQLVTAGIGGAMMVYAWPMLGLSLTWTDPLLFVLLVLGAVMIYMGIYVTLIALSLYTDAPLGVMPLMWNIQSYGRYPIAIYNTAMKVLLQWVLPFSFVGFYPASVFLRAQSYAVYGLCTPLVGIVCLSIGLLVWHRGILRYRGAGS
jgi:ABC-2 type transport system permease protein